MARSRSMFTAQEKAAVVKRYLVDKTPVSDLCDEFGLQPTQVYQWQRELFENAEAAFTRPSRKRKADDRKDKKIEALEARSCKKRSRR
ncbi:transposase [Roseiconus lacunae]|uniref:transposase n=1 Tax=Roseiconus lacunae TaxID=2605694 RepID=UPI00190FA579|nr:transposase [Roseiconus lacunae]